MITEWVAAIELQRTYAAGTTRVARPQFVQWGQWVWAEAEALTNGFLEPMRKSAESSAGQMQQLAKTLLPHTRGNVNWWKYRASNGRMEGINNKIRTMLRQTCGLRVECYIALKPYRLHDSRHALPG